MWENEQNSAPTDDLDEGRCVDYAPVLCLFDAQAFGVGLPGDKRPLQSQPRHKDSKGLVQKHAFQCRPAHWQSTRNLLPDWL